MVLSVFRVPLALQIKEPLEGASVNYSVLVDAKRKGTHEIASYTVEEGNEAT
jgi:hypothetical protein